MERAASGATALRVRRGPRVGETLVGHACVRLRFATGLCPDARLAGGLGVQEGALFHDVEGVRLAEGVGKEGVRVNLAEDAGA